MAAKPKTVLLKDVKKRFQEAHDITIETITRNLNAENVKNFKIVLLSLKVMKSNFIKNL